MRFRGTRFVTSRRKSVVEKFRCNPQNSIPEPRDERGRGESERIGVHPFVHGEALALFILSSAVAIGEVSRLRSGSKICVFRFETDLFTARVSHYAERFERIPSARKLLGVYSTLYTVHRLFTAYFPEEVDS